MEKDAVIIVIIAGTFILVLVACFTLSVVFAFQKRYYKHQQEINSMKEKLKQELYKTQLEIKEQTMKNISQEIHDNIGQVLSLANMQLTAIELNDNSHATNKIDKAMELVSKAINDLRNLSKSLQGDNIVKAGLIKSVKTDLELIEKTGKYTTSMHVTGDAAKIDPSKEIIAFRIVQEALNNVIKHARASRINVALAYTETVLIISVSDNGRGFAEADTDLNEDFGAGLQNMRNRAALIQGRLRIESSASRGTTVLLSVPVNDQKKQTP